MTSEDARPRVVVAITGASGAIFGVRTLERLRAMGAETHLLISTWGARTIVHETTYSVDDVRSLADVVHGQGNQAATISSGSFHVDGMIVAPCSVKTLASIAHGLADNLVTRAADVTIKERRQLVLMVRESPLSEIHLDNMLRLSRLGVTILPPMPAFYNHPRSLDDMVDHVVTRTLDQLNMRSDETPRWNGTLASRRDQPENDAGSSRP
jgi:4-hydroxy-3-polyprenylbenzoate decarboxylase